MRVVVNLLYFKKPIAFRILRICNFADKIIYIIAWVFRKQVGSDQAKQEGFIQVI